uniref:F-box domain-containing protein n=1 Tax=Panagrolaimus sp. JU765 TaxID=591449 RepID=A0AC34R1Q5_9BILA
MSKRRSDSDGLYDGMKKMKNLDDIKQEISEEKKNWEQNRKLFMMRRLEHGFCLNVFREFKRRADYVEREMIQFQYQAALARERTFKLLSIKNHMENPVKLCPDLYCIIFQYFIQKDGNKWLRYLDVDVLLKFMLIGERTLLFVFGIFRRTKSLYFDKDDVGFDRAVCMKYSDLTKIFIKFVSPFITHVNFTDRDSGLEYQNIVFKQLSEDSRQKTLTIANLIQVNNVAETALEKLVAKGTLIEFMDLKKELLPHLPALEFHSLVMNSFDDWHKLVAKGTLIEFMDLKKELLPHLPALEFHSLVMNSFDDWHDVLAAVSCSFRKFVVTRRTGCKFKRFPKTNRSNRNRNMFHNVEELSLELEFDDDFKRVFKNLQKYFPNVKKVTINTANSIVDEATDALDAVKFYDNFDESIVSTWKKIKEEIENAPQPEIIFNFEYFVFSRTKRDEMIQWFNGEEIDEETFRWTSTKNETKMIDFIIYGEPDY